jgi:hypothetical protein
MRYPKLYSEDPDREISAKSEAMSPKHAIPTITLLASAESSERLKGGSAAPAVTQLAIEDWANRISFRLR